jgi:hypothetical protein
VPASMTTVRRTEKSARPASSGHTVRCIPANRNPSAGAASGRRPHSATCAAADIAQARRWRRRKEAACVTDTARKNVADDTRVPRIAAAKRRPRPEGYEIEAREARQYLGPHSAKSREPSDHWIITDAIRTAEPGPAPIRASALTASTIRATTDMSHPLHERGGHGKRARPVVPGAR